LAIQAAGVTRKLLARLDAEADSIPARDLAGAARNAGTIAGISTDKQMLTRERPLPRPEPQRTLDEMIRSLTALGVLREIEPGPRVVDAEAEVVGDAESSEGGDPS